ncbi:MAG TPA: hypothetical protein VNA69_13455 [Thermoanaerobaculia bacterium]|nr:hypothetical protein [Thermoanaerobaculia bacterium]
MTIEEFERQIIGALLAGDDPVLAALREQYIVSSVRDRELNATGFVTRFDVPETAPRIDRKLLHLDDLQVELEGAKTPADTSLHVLNGRLRSLECFVYEGAFPHSPVITNAWYYGTKKYPGITRELLAERDLEELLEAGD